MIVTAAVFALLSLGAVVAWLAHVKGRPVMPWGLYGAVLGPVALPHILLLKGESGDERRWSPIRSGLPSGVRPCPHCYAPVHSEAIACRYCRKPFYAPGGDETSEETQRPSNREFEALERALARSGTKTRPREAGPGDSREPAPERSRPAPVEPEAQDQPSQPEPPSPEPPSEERRQAETFAWPSARNGEQVAGATGAARREDPPQWRIDAAATAARGDPAGREEEGRGERGLDTGAPAFTGPETAQPSPPMSEADAPRPRPHLVAEPTGERPDQAPRDRLDPAVERHGPRLRAVPGAARAAWHEDPPLRRTHPAPGPASEDGGFHARRDEDAPAVDGRPMQAESFAYPGHDRSWEYRELRPHPDRDAFVSWPPIERDVGDTGSDRWMPAPVALALVSIVAAALVFGPDLLDSVDSGGSSDAPRWLIENEPAPAASEATEADPPSPPAAREAPPRPGDAGTGEDARPAEGDPAVPLAEGSAEARRSAENPPAPPQPPENLPAPSPRADSEVAAVREPPSPPAASGGPISASGQLVVEVQRRLETLGYDPGPVDGRAGPRTRSAIREYQRDTGLDVTGDIDAAVLFQLGFD